ncbi:MAG: hypothetical protein HYV97_09135 [Bdellovibrio sp.]|nr:hypothetical protein [Bdellovibrio sp.]
MVRSIIILMCCLFTACDMVKRFEQRAAQVNNYEARSLELARENRLLNAQISDLKYELEGHKSKNAYLQLQLGAGKTGTDRSPASVPTVRSVYPENDLVNQATFKWGAKELMATAQKEFEQKNYEKSAQFFQTFIEQYPGHEALNDSVLFQAGVASYESGKHIDWVLKNLDTLLVKYPTSKHYRGAKLWMALAHLKQGDSKAFFGTVEEFRKKYRNTTEWQILSAHYERILQKYKE